MKLLDKLKNALFEEEYVEVEEKKIPKKEKKSKDTNLLREEKKIRDVKLTSYDEEEEPIVKKIAPKVKKDSPSLKEKEEEKKKEDFVFPSVSDDEFIGGDIKVTELIDEEESLSSLDSKKEDKEDVFLYQSSKDEYTKKHSSNEYGGYDKPSKKTFKPSPNISPIYGIIDDYGDQMKHKPRQEVRLTSVSRNEKLNIDDIRRKAFGTIEDDLQRNLNYDEGSYMEEANKLVDLRDNSAVEVNQVTMEDAEEYFEDLGLEYNSDYIDASRAKANGRRVQEDEKYDSPRVSDEEDISSLSEEELPNFLKESDVALEEDTKEEVDEDNLFDLIDSMYDK